MALSIPFTDPVGGVYFLPVPFVRISYWSSLPVVMTSLRLPFFSRKAFSAASFALANARSRSETIMS